MTTSTALLKQHYTQEQIKELKKGTGLKMAELGEILEMDFVDEELDIPDTDDLIEHISYQRSLTYMVNNCDSETELGMMWASIHC